MNKLEPYVIRRIIQGTLFLAGAVLVALGIVDETHVDQIIEQAGPLLTMLASGFALANINKNSDTDPDDVAERAARKAVKHTAPLEQPSPMPSMSDIMRGGEPHAG